MRTASLGAMSSANKETRILRLKAYLDKSNDKTFNSLTALKTAGVSNWGTEINYLQQIKRDYGDYLTPNGKSCLVIALREAKLLKKANERARK